MTNPHHFQRHTVLGLAVTATVIAVGMAVSVAWGRSVMLAEQILDAAVAAFIVVAAHLLPSVINANKHLIRISVWTIWAMCMTWVLYGHASFTVRALASAGELRAAAVAQPHPATPIPFTPKRSLAEIAEEEVRLKTDLSKLSLKVCAENCGKNQVKRVSLTARLDALGVEANEVRRWQSEREHQRALADQERNRRDAARDDPVIARLADVSSLTMAQHLELVMVLILAVALEGAGCLFWWGYLRSRESLSVTPGTTQDLVGTTPIAAVSADHTEDPIVARVRQAIKTGECDLTVRAIREYLGCAQSKATEIRKAVMA